MALTYYATLIGAQAAKVAAGGVGDIAWAGLTNKAKPFSLATGADMATVKIEPLRWAVLSCALGEMLKGGRRAGWANLIIEEFQKPFFDSAWAGVASACWNIMQLRVKR